MKPTLMARSLTLKTTRSNSPRPQNPLLQESYACDVNGNCNTTGYTVGTGGTLSASPNATYTYDAAGHVTAKTDTATGKVTTFSYDYRDRLTGATRKTSGSVVDYQVTYTYDALNRRIGEQIDADGAGSGAPVQTWTVFDGENPYADFNGSGTLEERYLYGPAVDSLLARTDASGVTDWYLADRLGSVRDVVDVSGNVVYHNGYDSFGNNISTSGTGGDRFGFTGREHDSALNLYYNQARFYDPATGRFLSRDPIGFEAGDANLYRYVGNGPTDGVDPSGKIVWVPILKYFGPPIAAGAFGGFLGAIAITDDYWLIAIGTVSGGIGGLGVALSGVSNVPVVGDTASAAISSFVNAQLTAWYQGRNIALNDKVGGLSSTILTFAISALAVQTSVRESGFIGGAISILVGAFSTAAGGGFDSLTNSIQILQNKATKNLSENGNAAIRQSTLATNPSGNREILPGGESVVTDTDKYEYILDPLFEGGSSLIASLRGVLEEPRL